MDVIADKSVDTYIARFGKDVVAKWIITAVPDDTAASGAVATPDGQGGWAIKNPVVVPPQPAPPTQATTKQQILDQIAVLKGLADSLP